MTGYTGYYFSSAEKQLQLRFSHHVFHLPYVLSMTPSQWKYRSYWVLLKSQSFLRGRKDPFLNGLKRGHLILTLPKLLYAQYNLMQISATARSHGKKSAHPTFSPVTRKAFQDTYKIVRPHLYEEVILVKLSQRWRTFYIPNGGGKKARTKNTWHTTLTHSALFSNNVKSDGPEVSGNLWVKPISQL